MKRNHTFPCVSVAVLVLLVALVPAGAQHSGDAAPPGAAEKKGNADSPGDTAGADDPGAQPETSEAGDAGAQPDAAAGVEDVSMGRRLYMEQNCALCHTAYARGIGEPPEGWSAGEGDGEESETQTAGGPPDLSVLAGSWTLESLRAYLVEREPVDGEKHVTGFRGSEEDWSALARWLTRSPAAPDSVDQSSARQSDAESEAGPADDADGAGGNGGAAADD